MTSIVIRIARGALAKAVIRNLVIQIPDNPCGLRLIIPASRFSSEVESWTFESLWTEERIRLVLKPQGLKSCVLIIVEMGNAYGNRRPVDRALLTGPLLIEPY